MRLVSKNFVVELNDEQVNVVVDALHVAYKHWKEQATKNGVAKSMPKSFKAKELRNDFASLVQRSFMGEDA